MKQIARDVDGPQSVEGLKKQAASPQSKREFFCLMAFKLNISFFLPFGPRMEYFWLSWVSRLPIHPAHLGICHEPIPYILILNLSIYVIYITRASQVALVIKNPSAEAGDIKRHRFDPWFGKILWRRAQQPTPVFLPGESHGQRSLVGYSPKGRKELNITKVTRT